MAGYRYGVIGAGRAGTAAAFDLAVRGEAEEVVLADIDPERALGAAGRVNRLAGRAVAKGVRLDALDSHATRAFLDPLDAALVAASYTLTLGVSYAGIEAGTHVCDLGGNTGVVLQQLQLSEAARHRRVCLVPDCGEAPGLASNLMAYAKTLLDQTTDLLLLDGGLPLHPKPPWNYRLTFNMDGLTNEYYGNTTFIVDGEPVGVESFDPAEYELVEFEPPFGVLEAFPAGGASTTPWTLGEGMRSFRNKVLRYPGHAAQFRAFRDLGLFEEEVVLAGGLRIRPRDVYHALMEPKIRADASIRDAVIARVVASGTKDGEPAEATVDFRAWYDDVLGFTAMEESTGWHAAIVCRLMASGAIEPGARPVELAVDPALMVEALQKRGFDVAESVQPA